MTFGQRFRLSVHGCYAALSAPGHSPYRDACRRTVRRSHAGSSAAILIGAVAVGLLSACSMGDGVGSFLVDPGRYTAYHCDDLVKRLTELQTRQKQLRDLMDRASEGGGGVVIGTLAYRTDYEKALGEEKVLRRTAAEKKCELAPPVVQTDQTER